MDAREPHPRDTSPKLPDTAKRRRRHAPPNDDVHASTEGTSQQDEEDHHPDDFILLSELYFTFLTVMIVETESGQLMDVVFFLLLIYPHWNSARHVEQLSQLKMNIPANDIDDTFLPSSMYLPTFLARRPRQFAQLVLQAHETGDYSAFPEQLVHDLGRNVYQNPTVPNMVTTTPCSPLSPDPFDLPHYLIEENWVTPDSAPPTSTIPLTTTRPGWTATPPPIFKRH